MLDINCHVQILYAFKIEKAVIEELLSNYNLSNYNKQSKSQNSDYTNQKKKFETFMKRIKIVNNHNHIKLAINQAILICAVFNKKIIPKIQF